LQDGVIRYVRIGDVEIVRRLYMALRDQNWNTIPTAFSDWKYEIGEDSFEITFTAENKQGEIDYKWKGSILGDRSGKITYSMSGLTLSSFKKRIIGLCALFPIKECAGSYAKVIRSDGESVSTSFPLFISPETPLPGFDDISDINYEAAYTPVTVKFEGDRFEMEDQRSFTDASFKVYSNWVRANDAEVVKAGDKVFQSISVSIDKTNGRHFEVQNAQNKPTIIELDPNREFQIPKLGLGASSVVTSLNQREIDLLKNIGFSHLRADVHLDSGDWRDQLRQLSTQIRQLGVSLELAVFVRTERDEKDLSLLKEELEILRPPIAAILMFNVGEFATKKDTIEICRRLFADYYSHPKIGGGTDRNYFDLAYAHEAYSPEDFASYAVNPQVHAFDVSSLMETLEGQSWTVSSAHKIYKDNLVGISPITLKPRFNPDAIVPESTEPGELPSQVDPRQISLFAACWLAGSVKELAESNAYSLTYFETVGWRGLIESEEPTDCTGKFFSKPGMVFPVYHVLCDICDMLPGNVRTARSTRPLAVSALCLVKGRSARILVCNLTWESQEALLRKIGTNQVRIKRLNEEVAEDAMFRPDKFRGDSGTIRSVDNSGDFELSLLPYEVARVDYQISG
jgi:D-apionolactonase